MVKVIRAFRNLAYLPNLDHRLHVIMIARERTMRDEQVVCPNLIGGLATDCGAFVDIIGRLSAVRSKPTDQPEAEGEAEGELRRHLLLEEYTSVRGLRYLAKNRGGRLGRHVWNPTMKVLADRWAGIGRPVLNVGEKDEEGSTAARSYDERVESSSNAWRKDDEGATEDAAVQSGL